MSEETNIFSIPALKVKYSKYASSLERLFKHNSLSALQDKLKNPVYFRPKEEKIDEEARQKAIFNYNKIIKESKVNSSSQLNNKQIKYNYTQNDKEALNMISQSPIDTKKRGNNLKVIKTSENKQKTLPNENEELSFRDILLMERQKK